MSLGYASNFFGESFLTEEVGSKYAVTDVWLGYVAVDSVCVCEENANIVEHSGCLDDFEIDAKFAFSVYAQCEVGNTAAMS